MRGSKSIAMFMILLAGTFALQVASAAPAREKLMNPAALTEKAPDTFKVQFETTKGSFVIEVTRAWSPNGADRFYNLAKNGFYDGVKFFRVVPNFVVQFGIPGDPAIGKAWVNANIKDDPVKESNKLGFVTYAKSPSPNSRTTQLFINLKDNSGLLDGQGFAPFGKVAEGMDVVEKLYSGYKDQPTNKQPRIYDEGNAFLEKEYPNLDSIKKAVILKSQPKGEEKPAPPAK